LKDLVRSGYITSSKSPQNAVSRAYLITHEDTAVNAAPKTVRDGALDFLERMFQRYTDKAGEQFKNDLLSTLEAQLMPFADREEGKNIYALLRDKDAPKKYLGKALEDTVHEWRNRWRLIVNTELSRASNFGAMDAILTNNKGIDPKDIIVYKTGPSDGAVCNECKKFWFREDFITPRVYRMSELLANGSNIGRKRREWKPTVDNTHPNERHLVLHELKPGWGFRAGGLSYISKDHDELRFQRGG
jgi:hypothetical protein